MPLLQQQDTVVFIGEEPGYGLQVGFFQKLVYNAATDNLNKQGNSIPSVCFFRFSA
jgi:hypothetical protein